MPDVGPVQALSLLWAMQPSLLGEPDVPRPAWTAAVCHLQVLLHNFTQHLAGSVLRDLASVGRASGMCCSLAASQTAALTPVCGPQIHVPDPDSDGITSGLWGDSHLSHTGTLPC